MLQVWGRTRERGCSSWSPTPAVTCHPVWCFATLVN